MDNYSKNPKTVFGKWLVLVFSILTFSMGFGIPVSLSVMFLDWQDTFRVTRVNTAVVHSTCVNVVLGGGILTGYVMNRIGARLTIRIGSVLATTGMLVSAFATSIDFLIVSIGIVGGFGFCFVQLPVIPCVIMVTEKYKTLMISLCLVSSGLSSIVYRIFFRYLVEHYSWRGTCIIAAGMELQSCVSGMIITAVVKPSKTSCLVESKKTYLDEDVGFKDVGKHLPSVILNDSLSSLKQEVNEKEKECKDGSSLSRKCSILPSGDSDELSRSSSVAVVSNHDFHLIRNDEDINGDHKETSNEYENGDKCKYSKWRFLKDIMFIMLSVHVGICISSLFSFSLILMDFARTLEYDEKTGVIFLNVTFAASIFSRLGVGIVSDFFTNINSFAIQTVCTIPGCVSLVILSFCKEFAVVVCLLIVVGISVGGLITIYPKSAIDLKSVDRASYPIAFGILCSIEGIMGIAFSTAIGYSVDKTDSYTLILILIGSVGLLTTFILGSGYYFANQRQKQQRQSQKQLQERQ